MGHTQMVIDTVTIRVVYPVTVVNAQAIYRTCTMSRICMYIVLLCNMSREKEVSYIIHYKYLITTEK